MRYNPPPNWPAPPEGWEPSADWTPDPSWPPPPPGWRLWVDDGPVSNKTKSALNRLGRTSDDVEYFGDDRAWSEDSGRLPAHERMNSGEPGPPPRPTEVAPVELSAQHLGQRASIRWDDEHRYDIGTIVAVSADSAAVSVRLAGFDEPVVFPREAPHREVAGPRLYVWS